MKSFALIALLFGACAAQEFRASQSGNDIVITRSESENDGAGTFKWLSELSDGTKLEQNGYVKAGPDPENPIQVIQGSFSYIAPDGTPISLRYIADENGFQPEADHLPTPPPVPEAIQRALDVILRNADNQAGARPAAPQQAPKRPSTPPRSPQRG